MTIYVRRLANALADDGVATDVFTRAINDAPLVTQVTPDVRVVSIEAGPRTHLDKQTLSSHLDEFVAGVLRFSSGRPRYDVVHSHYWQSGIAGLDLAGKWGVPLVHSAHSLAQVKNAHLAPGDSPEPQRRIDGESRVIGGADVLIASTDSEWQQLSCLYGAPHDRLKTIHPGVDHRMFAPGDRVAAKAQLGLSDQGVMLFVGRIQPLKGLELAVETLSEISRSSVRPVMLVVAGGPSGAQGDREMTRLRELAARLGLADRIRFAGPQAHATLPTFYRAADILAVCSYSESFGLSALEAQACGTPVIGTEVGGLSHVVADGSSGYLIDCRDAKLFAERALTLLENNELFESFSAAAITAASSFTWERTASAYKELYSCLVTERAPELCTC
jgi:D-inositol-3-phosphate glycosyltransferase